MKRRVFIKSLGILPLVPAVRPIVSFANSNNSNNYSLTAQQAELRIFKSKPATKIFGFSDKLFAKPIYAKQDEQITVKVSNKLNQELGVHWHGIRLSNNMDGIPHLTQKPIRPNKELFKYQFSSPDAGTYWYHAHSNSAEQVEKGLLGPLIIKEAKKYAVDYDLTLLIKDWKLNNKLQIVPYFSNRHEMSHDGRWGNVITTNGKYNPSYFYKANSRIRLRFINGANARVLSLNLSSFEKATIIALDGHPVAPKPYKPRYLAPGMRMDVVVDVNTLNKIYSIFDTFNNKSNKLMNIHTTKQRERKKSLVELPQALPPNPVAYPKLRQADEINVSLEGGAMSGMMKGMLSGMFWSINGKAKKENDKHVKPLINLKKKKSYIFNIKNNTRFAHPMHIHGHTFKVLSKDPYWSDTAFLLPNSTTKIAFVADNPGLWMFHCHILEHQVSGMMGVIEVA